MSVLIDMSKVYFQYLRNQSDNQWLLSDINLSIEKGEFVAILGANGSGKSTLAKHFNALLVPSDGKVQINGMDTREEQNKLQIRQTVGMIFQNPDNQLISTIIEEDVAFAPENLGLPPEEIHQRVDWALNAVDMSAYRLHTPFKLSGGQKQRIAIAGVLAMRPQCIIMDEPTSMLDPSGRASVLRTIHRLNTTFGITIVLITHHLEEAAQAQRILVMDRGRIVMDDPPESIFSQFELLHQLNLGIPPITLLTKRLQRHGIDLPANTMTADKCADAIIAMLEAHHGNH
ncbi:energy-coupling factor transporter ATPase [Sporolactobacillus sp. CPB3-1]|uniref:Energy-coupling factor transporter ATPase n=1 Tax=Sporolactobacillus mangiferae TaxID=2940498 RepID=A0ABT0MDG8_9BACL|nr:energy-coupling factor transporter ATPase [Sporolactobacillus mangiferae]MCL1632910.1 energy-coupling factor transporter ATPase [Sporolactobacillus mangiferae]